MLSFYAKKGGESILSECLSLFNKRPPVYSSLLKNYKHKKNFCKHYNNTCRSNHYQNKLSVTEPLFNLLRIDELNRFLNFSVHHNIFFNKRYVLAECRQITFDDW